MEVALSLRGRPRAGARRHVEVAEAGIVVNRVPQWRLVYEYRDERGVQHGGQSDLMRPHEAAQWQPGEAGRVRFDRDRSADSFWLGRC